MSIRLSILCMLVSVRLAAQCTCSEQFSFVKKQIETNYAGFNDKVKLYGRKNYDALTQKQSAIINGPVSAGQCFVAIAEWLEFFKDGHVHVYSADVEHPDTAESRKRIASAEVINIPPARLKELEYAKGIEGIYVHSDSVYTIAVIASKNKFRDYVGVIIDSKTETWKVGQVKLELKKENDTLYKTLLYYRDHTCGLQHYALTAAGLNGNEWQKYRQIKIARMPVEEEPESPINIKKLSESTLYIQILTFQSSYAKMIDSAIKHNEQQLKTMPNLVLDLRKNGGGSDFSYHPLLPYLYTQPVIGIGVDVWATKDNIANWKRMIIESPDIPESSKADARELLVRMGAHLGHFVLSSEDDTSIVDNPSSFPQKVVILIDGQCASSTEQFLLWARQSKRVTLMGSHTDGVLDYSNVRSSITPCKEISIFYATTRSRRIDKGMAIDNIGIKPDIVLPENSDWIEAARKYLEK
jgi:hypothetical protein